eukprot:4923989-Amphidinium_carterae.1
MIILDRKTSRLAPVITATQAQSNKVHIAPHQAADLDASQGGRDSFDSGVNFVWIQELLLLHSSDTGDPCLALSRGYVL